MGSSLGCHYLADLGAGEALGVSCLSVLYAGEPGCVLARCGTL